MKLCPSSEHLKAFAVGDLNGTQFEETAAHLADCTLCEEALAALDHHKDGLVSELRQLPVTDPNSVPDSILEAATSGASGVWYEQGTRPNTTLDPGRAIAGKLADGPVRLERFELRRELGGGSFGHVFQAHDLELDRDVAVKIGRVGSLADKNDVHAFLREARAAARLSHPGIVAIYDSGQTEDGVCYLVSELIEGETLESRLEREHYSPNEAAQLAVKLADALTYAHEHDVIHRDIKPSNIVLDYEGCPHVTDFGLAKQTRADQTDTVDGKVLGTPAYMSPEQARGESHAVDARSDVYSLGVLFYELLTGERPFQGRQRLALLQVLEEEPRPLRALNEQIPKDLETICLKAMAKSRARRYPKASDFAADVRRYLAGEAITARPISRTERLWRWCRQYPLAASIIVAVATGSIVGFSFLSRLSNSLVRDTALDGVRREADLFEGVNAFYSEQVLSRLNRVSWDVGKGRPEDEADWIQITHEYASMKDALPYPKTFTKDSSKVISDNVPGMHVRLYSDYPWRIDGEEGPRSEFERTALETLQALSKTNDAVLEHHEFVVQEGQPKVLYARAQLMKENCISCHNSHTQSPKTDWKIGDLAGVLTITRPLDGDIKRTKAGMRGAFMLVAGTALTLLTLSLVLLPRRRNVTR